MSFIAIGFVMGLTLPANEKWLLVCLAEYADDWGDSVFPSLDELEQKSGMSRSTLKRTIAKLLQDDRIARVALATPFSPPFYRILGLPEPTEQSKRSPQCPVALRRAVLYVFDGRCEYCGQTGTRELGPDDKPWHVDRVVPGARGGVYSPDNVTLSCRGCNIRKKDRSAQGPVRTLTDRQNEGVQLDPSPDVQEADQVEPSPGFLLDSPGVQIDPPRGFTVNPDPFSDPVIDPATGVKAGASPRPPSETHEEAGAAPPSPKEPAANVGVITKLAHGSIDVLGLSDRGDLREDLKGRCASLHIAYDSMVIDKAIESAIWQRQHGAGA